MNDSKGTSQGPQISALTQARQPPPSPIPSPLLTLCLQKQQKILVRFHPEGSIPRNAGRRVCVLLTQTDSHGLDDAFPSSGASRLLSRGNLCVCEESRQFLLVRKDTGARKPILSMTSKRGPAKTETCAMTICRKEGCCQLSSPQNSGDLCLDPQKPDPQEPAFLQELRALHQRPSTVRLVAQAICPEHVHSHSKDVSAALEWL